MGRSNIGHSNIGPSIFGAPMGSRLAVTLQSPRLCTNTPLGAALELAREVADFLLGRLALVGCRSSRLALGLIAAWSGAVSGQSVSFVAWFASKCKLYQ